MPEKETLQLFVNHLAPKIPFRTKFYICCFNQSDKEKIVAGFKNVFSVNEVMSGPEFCAILGIDFNAIVKLRGDDASDNFKYIVESLFEIKEVRSEFLQKNRVHIPEEDFYAADEFNAPDYDT